MTGELPQIDGYRWLSGGAPIAGATGQTYTPGSPDASLSCEATVTYPLLRVTASATSQAVPVTAPPAMPAGVLGPAGPSGAAGSAGATGASGARGPAGATGKVKLVAIDVVTCKPVTSTVTETVTVNGKKVHKQVKVTRKKCTTKVVSGGVKNSIATSERATLERSQVVYATGTMTRTRLVLHARRAVRRGRYTLTLVHKQARRLLTSHQEITIG